MLKTQEDVIMKTNKFKQTLTGAFLTMMALTLPAPAIADQVIASFERESNHQQGAGYEISRSAIETDVLYREINQSLYSTTKLVNHDQSAPDQVVASFARELNHEAATPRPTTRVDIDTDVLYVMLNKQLQSVSASKVPGLILLAEAE